jgi:hypothetical protein
MVLQYITVSIIVSEMMGLEPTIIDMTNRHFNH